MQPPPIECPSCSHGNPAGSNFCNACGMPVGFVWCPHCDGVNRTSAAQCYKCGEVLAAAECAEAPVVSDAAAAAATSVEFAPVTTGTRQRRMALRAATTSALLVALAVPAYLTRQDFTPLPAMAAAPAVAPAAEPAPLPEAASAPPANAAQPTVKAKPRSGTRKPRTDARKPSNPQSAARGATQIRTK